MALNTSQLMVLHWFYSCHAKGEPVSYKGSIEHFGQVFKINDPLNVIKSLLDMGLISINKSGMDVSITKAGIQQYESIKKSTIIASCFFNVQEIMLFNFLDMGFAKGISLAVLRGVLRNDSSVEGDLGSHSEEQGAIAFCSYFGNHTTRYACAALSLRFSILWL